MLEVINDATLLTGSESGWEDKPEQVVDAAEKDFFDRLEVTDPGPDLAMMLAGIDRSRLNGYHLVTVMAARARQIAHDQAEFYSDISEMAQCPPGTDDSPAERVEWADFDDEFAHNEIAAALRLTRRGAQHQLGLAINLTERLPQVGETLRNGRIDLDRARRIITTTQHLPVEDARRVVGHVIDEAGDWTTGQLGSRLQRRILTQFGDQEKEHYEYGLEQRAVKAYPNPDGTANLVAASLPGDKVAAMMRKLTRLAKTTQTTGDTRNIDQRRADVLSDLLLGNQTGDGSDRAVVDIRVNLETLLGLSEAPGEIPGWGPVISDIARRLVAGNHDGEWRWAVPDPDTGAVLADGTTRRRPTNIQKRWVEARRPTCVFPGCRMPARDSDIDHTQSRSDGGHTVVKNLEPLCKHHHRLKHETPWYLERIDDTYVWTSPLGHTYTTSGQSP